MTRKLILLPFIALIIFGCSSSNHLHSKWQNEKYSNPITISRLDYQYNSDFKLFYLITNDRENLFVHLKVDDRIVQKRLLLNGFTIWVDTMAKAKKHLGIKYQVDQNKLIRKTTQLEYYLPPDKYGNTQTIQSYFIKNTLQEFIGFNEELNKLDDIQFTLLQDSSQSMIFRATIPLKYIPPKKKNMLSLIIESKMPDRTNQAVNPHPSPNNSMRGMGGKEAVEGKEDKKDKEVIQTVNQTLLKI